MVEARSNCNSFSNCSWPEMCCANQNGEFECCAGVCYTKTGRYLHWYILRQKKLLDLKVLVVPIDQFIIDLLLVGCDNSTVPTGSISSESSVISSSTTPTDYQEFEFELNTSSMYPGTD